MTDTYLTPPGDEGWSVVLEPDYFAFQHLQSGAMIEIWRPEWGNETRFISPKESIHPWMNIYNLWWRPA